MKPVGTKDAEASVAQLKAHAARTSFIAQLFRSLMTEYLTQDSKELPIFAEQLGQVVEDRIAFQLSQHLPERFGTAIEEILHRLVQVGALCF